MGKKWDKVQTFKSALKCSFLRCYYYYIFWKVWKNIQFNNTGHRILVLVVRVVLSTFVTLLHFHGILMEGIPKFEISNKEGVREGVVMRSRSLNFFLCYLASPLCFVKWLLRFRMLFGQARENYVNHKLSINNNPHFFYPAHSSIEPQQNGLLLLQEMATRGLLH